MLGWSINLFRIRGIRLSLHFSFVLLLAYAAEEGWRESGWTGVAWGVGALVAFFTCVVLHELGHSFTAMHFGANVRRILLLPIGGMAEFDRIPRRPLHEILITVAGPAVNFVIAGLLWCLVRFPPHWTADTATETLGDVARTLIILNLTMGCFNLIPAFPMDGGRILRALLATRLSYVRATFWAVTIASVLIPLGVVVALLLPETQEGIRVYLTIGMGIFLLMAGRTEYRAIKQRDEEEAEWRQTLIRHISINPAPEPPILKA
jgi:Zn-dependent protease